MINSLQSLRGIFAIVIFLHHFAEFHAGGDCGVSFFIILSGFVLCGGYQHRLDRGEVSVRKFMNKRLSKLYPLHVLCLVSAIILKCRSASLPVIGIWIGNLLLLQSWIPVSEVYFSGNAVSWYLSTLMFSYAMFPYIVRKINKQRGANRLLYCILGSVCLYFLVIQIIPENFKAGLVYVNPVFRIYDFCLGILLWQVYDSLRKHSAIYSQILRMPKAAKTLVEVIAVALMVVYVILYPFVPVEYSLASYWWLPTGCLIMTFALFDRSKGLLSRVLEWPVLVKFGDISFSFYMIHVLVYQYLGIILRKLSIIPSHGLMLLYAFILTTALAYACQCLFVKPMSAAWMKWTGNHRS